MIMSIEISLNVSSVMENNPSVKGGKSGKMKKAESLILKGQDLQIISEETFYDLLSDYIDE